MRTIQLIFGKTGTGKTTLAKKLMRDYNRIVIVDSLIEYTEGIIFFNVLDLAEYHLKNNPVNFKYVCRFTSDSDFNYLFKWIYIVGNICIVAEEAEIYINPKATQSDFLRLVRYGRHKNISIIGIARRTTELSIDFRSQCNYIYSFKQTEPNDLKKMELLGFTNLDKLGLYEFIRIEP